MNVIILSPGKTEKYLKVPILPRLAAQKMLICLSVLWEFKSQLGELSMDKDIPIVNKSNTDLLYSWKKCLDNFKFLVFI